MMTTTHAHTLKQKSLLFDWLFSEMQKRRCTKSKYWNTPEQNQKQPLWRLELNQFYRSVLRNSCLLFMTWLMRKDVYVTICFLYIYMYIKFFMITFKKGY